jgi:hypothetical protein
MKHISIKALLIFMIFFMSALMIAWSLRNKLPGLMT